MQEFYKKFLVLRQLPVPVIAAINGPAVGAGFCLATSSPASLARRWGHRDSSKKIYDK